MSWSPSAFAHGRVESSAKREIGGVVAGAMILGRANS